MLRPLYIVDIRVMLFDDILMIKYTNFVASLHALNA